MKILIVMLLVLALAVPAVAATNFAGTLPQPEGATRFYSQHELHQAAAYRSEPGQFRESGGDSGSGSGASGDSGAGSAGDSTN